MLAGVFFLGRRGSGNRSRKDKVELNSQDRDSHVEYAQDRKDVYKYEMSSVADSQQLASTPIHELPAKEFAATEMDAERRKSEMKI